MAPDDGRAADRLRRVGRLAESLSAATTTQAAVDAVVEAGTDELMADSVSVSLLTADKTSFAIAGHGGLRPDMALRWATFPADADVPIADAVRQRRIITIDGVADRERRYPVLGTGPIRSETLVAVPLLIRGDQPLGALAIGFDERREVDDVDLAFIGAAADICAQAIHHARLIEYREQTLRRQASLAEASRVLAEELDHAETLDRVARLVVADVADVCAVCLWDGDALRTAAAIHADPHGQQVLDKLVARDPVIRRDSLIEIARGDEGVFVPRIDPADRSSTAQDAAHLALLEELDTTSGIVVPMRARGESIGLLLVLRTGAAPALTEDDLRFTDDLASRAALAIDNARLFTERTALIGHLQSALASQTAIEQAKGVLATRWGVSPTEAFERMRRHARSTRRSLAELADEVVAGTDDLG